VSVRAPQRWLSLAAAIAAVYVVGCGGGHDNRPASIGPSKPAQVDVGENVVRIPGRSPGDVAAAAVLSQYGPGGESGASSGWIVVRGQAWREAMIAAQFAAKPVSAAVMPVERDWIPPGPADALRRVRVNGFPKADGLTALVLGSAGSDVFLEIESDLDLKMTQLKASSPAKLAAAVVPFRGGWAGAFSSSVVIVSSESIPYALPGAAWSAFSGDSLAYVSRKGVPPATAKLLAQRKKLRLENPAIYVIGPRSVIPDSVVSRLSAFGPVKRVAGPTPAATSVALARYKDRGTGFGWGMTKGPASVLLVNTEDWANAFAAFTYAATGPHAPLLLTDSADELPKPVAKYLASMRGPQPGQAFVFGSTASISQDTMSALDEALAPKSPTRATG
jgi:hypothetical protein